MNDQLGLFEPKRGKVGHAHPDTSHDAADAIEPSTGTLRRKVLDLIVRCGTYGATDAEIQVALDMDGNTERPRRVELVDAGLVVDSGRRRTPPSGRSSIVWRAA